MESYSAERVGPARQNLVTDDVNLFRLLFDYLHKRKYSDGKVLLELELCMNGRTVKVHIHALELIYHL